MEQTHLASRGLTAAAAIFVLVLLIVAAPRTAPPTELVASAESEDVAEALVLVAEDVVSINDLRAIVGTRDIDEARIASQAALAAPVARDYADSAGVLQEIFIDADDITVEGTDLLAEATAISARGILQIGSGLARISDAQSSDAARLPGVDADGVATGADLYEGLETIGRQQIAAGTLQFGMGLAAMEPHVNDLSDEAQRAYQRVVSQNGAELLLNEIAEQIAIPGLYEYGADSRFTTQARSLARARVATYVCTPNDNPTQPLSEAPPREACPGVLSPEQLESMIDLVQSIVTARES